MTALLDLPHDERLAASLASPAHLSKHLHPERVIPRHVTLISDAVVDAIEEGHRTGVGPFVIIEAPPGHIKSDTISIHTPLWFLSRWGDKRVALAAHTHALAASWGRQNRQISVEHADKMVLRLRNDSKAADRWHTEQGGGMMCVGVGGPLTGFRADLVICDDPVKDAEQARSDVYREKTWAWWQSVALTRLWPEAPAIVLMTRWHADDLIGRIKANHAASVEQGTPTRPLIVITLPCEAEDNDPLGREPGELLWPEGGYDREWADLKRVDVGSRVWQALYQQRPTAEGGAIFRRKDFRYFYEDGDSYVLRQPDGKFHRVAKTACRHFNAVDTAMTEKQTSDYTVCTTFAQTPQNAILAVRVQRDRLEVPDQWPFLQAAIRYAEGLGNYAFTTVEDKASGIGLLQTAKRYGVPLRASKAQRDKVTRATGVATWCEGGSLYLNENMSNLATVEDELLVFPNGAHDDIVDTFAHGFNEMRRMPEPVATPPRYEQPDENETRGMFGDMVPARMEF